MPKQKRMDLRTMVTDNVFLIQSEDGDRGRRCEGGLFFLDVSCAEILVGDAEMGFLSWTVWAFVGRGGKTVCVICWL